jgi:hypothetical protein
MSTKVMISTRPSCRFVGRLAGWLACSRRCRPGRDGPRSRSDVDLLAIVDPSPDAAELGWDAHEWVEQEADAAGDRPVYYSMRVFDTEWLADRRRIRSFFIQEVDRDKIVLYGDALEKLGQGAKSDR